MAVYKSNNKYYYRGKYKDIRTGKYIQYKRLAKGAKSKKEAAKIEEIFLKNVSAILYSESYFTFDELSLEYLNVKKRIIKESTLVTDKICLKVINSVFGSIRINLITKKMVNDFIASCDNKYSSNYTSKIFYTMKKIFNYAVDNNYLESNLFFGVYLPTHKDVIKSDIMFWTPEQFQFYINNCNIRREYYVLINFLYYMGCRKGEALALKWSDIDLINNKVHIYQTVNHKTDGSIRYKITTPKTKNSNRYIKMPLVLLKLMIDWKNEQSSMYGFKNDCFVFGCYDPLPPETFRRHFHNSIISLNEELNKKGLFELPVIHIHCLRHSHASYLISKKMYDYDIAKRLGDTVDTLHKTYAHWFENAEDDILNALNDDFQ